MTREINKKQAPGGAAVGWATKKACNVDRGVLLSHVRGGGEGENDVELGSGVLATTGVLCGEPPWNHAQLAALHLDSCKRPTLQGKLWVPTYHTPSPIPKRLFVIDLPPCGRRGCSSVAAVVSPPPFEHEKPGWRLHQILSVPWWAPRPLLRQPAAVAVVAGGPVGPPPSSSFRVEPPHSPPARSHRSLLARYVVEGPKLPQFPPRWEGKRPPAWRSRRAPSLVVVVVVVVVAVAAIPHWFHEAHTDGAFVFPPLSRFSPRLLPHSTFSLGLSRRDHRLFIVGGRRRLEEARVMEIITAVVAAATPTQKIRGPRCRCRTKNVSAES